MYFFYGQNELRPNEFFYKIDIGLKKKEYKQRGKVNVRWNVANKSFVMKVTISPRNIYLLAYDRTAASNDC